MKKKGFNLVYSDGLVDDLCPQGRTTTVGLACTTLEGGGPGFINYGNGGCSVTFSWPTISGCPVCTDNDYTQIVGDCSDGGAPVIGKRISLCNGPDTRDEGKQECSQEVKFPIWIVIIIGIVVFLVISAAIIFFVQGRRDRRKYRLLLSEQGKSVEFDDKNHGNIQLDDHPNFVVADEDEK